MILKPPQRRLKCPCIYNVWCIMHISLTNPQEQNVTQLRVFVAVYNDNTTWRVAAAAAEIAKPAKYGSLYRHINIYIYLYIIYLYTYIRCGHQSTSVVVRIVFCFYGRSDANSTGVRLFFCHLHTIAVHIHINPRVHRRRMLFDPPRPPQSR